MPTLLERERSGRVRQRIQRSLQTIRRSVRRAVEADAQKKQGETAVAALKEANPQFTQLDAVTTAIYIALWFGMAAVYVLDYFLLSPLAEYIASLGHGGAEGVATAAGFATPAAVILLESGIAVLRYSAYRAWLEGVSSATAYVGWTIAAFVVPVLLAAGVMALVMAAEGEAFDAKISLPVMGAIAGLSLTLHLLIMCGSRPAMESKAWAVFNIKQAVAKGRIQGGERGYRRQSQFAADTWATYLNDIDAHNAGSPSSRIEPGPFDLSVRRVLNDVYGYEVIRLPDAASGSEPAARRAPHQTPPDAAPAAPEPVIEDDHRPAAPDAEWEALMARQMREQESEIRG